MRRAKAFDVKKEIARQLHISELDYIPAVQDRLTDPEMCNYQVVLFNLEKQIQTLKSTILTRLQSQMM